MGRIVFPRAELTATLSEIVGHKSGLALDELQLSAHLDGQVDDLLLGDGEEIVTIRAEEAEDIVSHLLYAVGSTPIRRTVHPGSEVMHRVKHLPGGLESYNKFQQILLSEFKKQEESKEPFDFTPVLERANAEIPEHGGVIALLYYDFTQISLQQNPWSQIRSVQWEDVKELDELFESEALDPTHGSYLDQRFIDYLERNIDAIDRMNWRKFEGLTCEFFERLGFHVEIGEGRNDGGIDARVWPNAQSTKEPPALLIQCKRQKDKIDKVVVKALWADVLSEGARSGLVVTTSQLSPGAARVCSARAYPIHEANREAVTAWLALMRSPNTGVFLGL